MRPKKAARRTHTHFYIPLTRKILLRSTLSISDSLFFLCKILEGKKKSHQKSASTRTGKREKKNTCSPSSPREFTRASAREELRDDGKPRVSFLLIFFLFVFIRVAFFCREDLEKKFLRAKHCHRHLINEKTHPLVTPHRTSNATPKRKFSRKSICSRRYESNW